MAEREKAGLMYIVLILSAMLQRLSLLPLESLAKTSGFVLRRPRKLSLEAFLQSILLGPGQPSYSLQNWAAQLSALQSVLFSKQVICLRKRGQVLVNYCLDFADAREFQIRVERGSLVSCVVAWDYRRFRYNQRAWLGRGRDFWECDFGSTRF
jgi:hypothetical protein